jgi:hypothetical protein
MPQGVTQRGSDRDSVPGTASTLRALGAEPSRPGASRSRQARPRTLYAAGPTRHRRGCNGQPVRQDPADEPTRAPQVGEHRDPQPVPDPATRTATRPPSRCDLYGYRHPDAGVAGAEGSAPQDPVTEPITHRQANLRLEFDTEISTARGARQDDHPRCRRYPSLEFQPGDWLTSLDPLG